MAKIKAKVVENLPGSLTLDASRQGSCGGCKQNKQCALLWNTDAPDKMVFFDVYPNGSIRNQEQVGALKKGDIVQLSCGEKELLNYICMLFFPSLFIMSVSALLIDAFLHQEPSILSIFVLLLFSIGLGAKISRFLLHKNANNLSKTLISKL